MQLARIPMWVWFVLCSVGLRFFSFFPSVLDHDESTYLVIGQVLRQGGLYWQDAIDTKPVGMFGIVAGIHALFGTSIWVFRLITALVIAFTAQGLYRVQQKMGFSTSAAIASGFIYLFCTSIFTFYGLSPNTELYFSCLSIWALVLLLGERRVSFVLLAGLLLGYGFLIKYVALADMVAIGGFVLYRWITTNVAVDTRHGLVSRKFGGTQTRHRLVSRKFGGAQTRHGLVSTAALVGLLSALLPFAGVAAWYYHQGMWPSFLFYSFEVSKRYFIDTSVADSLKYLADAFLRFLPVTIWFVLGNRWAWRKELAYVVFILFWLLCDLAFIILPGKLFGHYFIQAFLPVSLAAGLFFDQPYKAPRVFAWMRSKKVGRPILGILVVAILVIQWNDCIRRPDYPRQVSQYLKTRMSSKDVLYAGNYHQIVYLLTDKKPPTPFVHRSLLWDKANVFALKIDQRDALQAIFKQKPRFVLWEVNDKVTMQPMESFMQTYRQVKTFKDGKILVFERGINPIYAPN